MSRPIRPLRAGSSIFHAPEPWSTVASPRLAARLAFSDQSLETNFDLWTLPLDLTDPEHPKPASRKSSGLRLIVVALRQLGLI
jgi:hypothetical protein